LEGTERIRRIVSDLKHFSHTDQDKRKPTDINKELETTLNVVWNELKYKCTIVKDFGELPLLLCNPGQLNQVFANLFINAAQAIEKQGTITITTRHVTAGAGKKEDSVQKEYIEIGISDTGSGIAEDKIEKIFEPFFTTKEVGKGTGLGLSIVYDIIKKHNGDITVQSEAGKGTNFTVRLPVVS